MFTQCAQTVTTPCRGVIYTQELYKCPLMTGVRGNIYLGVGWGKQIIQKEKKFNIYII